MTRLTMRNLRIDRAFGIDRAQLTAGTLTLAALLVVQLIGAAVLRFSDAESGQALPQTPLLSLTPDAIDSVRLTDGKTVLRLERKSGAWLLPDEHGLAADEGRAAKLLESLAALKRGLPVATTVASRTQLEVAEDKHQRRIDIAASGTAADVLFVGTSPGFRRAHVRRAGEDEIYSANLNVFELPLTADDWLDSSLLAVTGLTRIEAADFTLQKTDETWSFAGGEGGDEAVDADRVAALIDTLENLRVEGIADADGGAAAAATGTDEATDSDATQTERLAFVLHEASRRYRLVLSRQGETVRAERDDMPVGFDLPVSTFDTLAGIDRSALTVESGDTVHPSTE